MTFVIDPVFTAIAAALAMGIGAWLKSKPDFRNRFIPIVTAVITFLGQLVAASQAEAGFFNYVVNGVVWANALIVWLATTGLVSVGKNTIKGDTSDKG